MPIRREELSESDRARLDSILNAYDQAVTRGESPLIESMIEGLAEPLYTFAVFELVQREIQARRNVEQVPEEIEYCIRFPNQIELVSGLFRTGDIATVYTPTDGPSFSIGLAPGFDEHLRDCGFELLEEIGRGSFGKVFRARRETDNQIVAIKILDPQPTAKRRETELFLRESQIHAKLVHPAIVPFYQGGVFEERVVWFAMEYVPGPDLQSYVDQRPGGLPIVTAINIVSNVLEGLHHFHRIPPPDGPYVHRDVKPRNILVLADEDEPKGVLSDFGLAKNYEQAGLSGITETGMVCGTLLYMSPEQLYDSKYAGPDCDIFAMGAVLYFALTGRIPYDLQSGASHHTVIQHVVNRRIVPITNHRTDLSDSLIAIVGRALREDRTRRFHSANQMKVALEDALNDL